MILCGHPAHPIEFAMAVATMGGIGGVLLWVRCIVTTTLKKWRGDA